MDLEGVRTFITAADTGKLQEAAFSLSITQQAASKRLAALEKSVGVRLFDRTPAGVRLTVDGHTFLPHARALLQAAERAAESVRPTRRALRVDLPGRRTGPGKLMRDFKHAHPDTMLDVVSLADVHAAVAAIDAGVLDASIRALTFPPRKLPPHVTAVRVYDEALLLLVGSRHPLARAESLSPPDLVGHRIWMPHLPPGSEWADVYDHVAAHFNWTITTLDPTQGADPLIEAIADSPGIATIVGEETNFMWPPDYGLRVIPIRGPTPAYPHALIYSRQNRHPDLAALTLALADTPTPSHDDVWTPRWGPSHSD